MGNWKVDQRGSCFQGLTGQDVERIGEILLNLYPVKRERWRERKKQEKNCFFPKNQFSHTQYLLVKDIFRENVKILPLVLVVDWGQSFGQDMVEGVL